MILDLPSKLKPHVQNNKLGQSSTNFLLAVKSIVLTKNKYNLLEFPEKSVEFIYIHRLWDCKIFIFEY